MTEKLRKQKRIKDFKAGDIIRDLFVVKFKKPIQEYARGYRFELRLGDASGEVMLKYWGDNNKENIEKMQNEKNCNEKVNSLSEDELGKIQRLKKLKYLKIVFC